MKVVLVHDFLTQYGGGERVLSAFAEIWPDAPIYCLGYDQKLIDEYFPGRTIIPSFLQNMPGMPKAFKYYLGLIPRAVESWNFDQFDLVVSDTSSFVKGIKTNPQTKHVCYLHTPTRYLTSDKEYYFQTAPIPFPLLGKPVVKAILWYLRGWDLKASKRPDMIVANSHYIAERTKTYYHRQPEHVLFPPVDTDRFHVAKTIDYWLVVARQEPYKRTDIAIQAANSLGLKLKVVGSGTRAKDLLALAGPTVEFVGRVSDEELADIYSHAIGFIFPPKEDAGITPLEAMAAGRPVIAYGEGGALESVVAGKTGEFFPQQTAESLVNAIKKFDQTKYDPQTIRAHAETFDVSVFKKKFKDFTEELLKNSK